MKAFDELHVNFDTPEYFEVYIWNTNHTLIMTDAEETNTDHTVTPSHHSCVHSNADTVYRGQLVAVKDTEGNKVKQFPHGGLPVVVAVKHTNAEHDDVSVYIADSDIDIRYQL